jgi:hypothetical protein
VVKALSILSEHSSGVQPPTVSAYTTYAHVEVAWFSY